MCRIKTERRLGPPAAHRSKRARMEDGDSRRRTSSRPRDTAEGTSHRTFDVPLPARLGQAAPGAPATAD